MMIIKSRKNQKNKKIIAKIKMTKMIIKNPIKALKRNQDKIPKTRMINRAVRKIKSRKTIKTIKSRNHKRNLLTKNKKTKITIMIIIKNIKNLKSTKMIKIPKN